MSRLDPAQSKRFGAKLGCGYNFQGKAYLVMFLENKDGNATPLIGSTLKVDFVDDVCPEQAEIKEVWMVHQGSRHFKSTLNAPMPQSDTATSITANRETGLGGGGQIPSNVPSSASQIATAAGLESASSGKFLRKGLLHKAPYPDNPLRSVLPLNPPAIEPEVIELLEDDDKVDEEKLKSEPASSEYVEDRQIVVQIIGENTFLLSFKMRMLKIALF